jgi:hypothetical protein
MYESKEPFFEFTKLVIHSIVNNMKIFFPPFVAFCVFAFLVYTQSFVHPMHLSDMGQGNMHAFKACFYYCWPLYFITALLAQGLIMVPVWEGKHGARLAMGKFLVFIFTCLVCFISAFVIAYIIWDRSTGRLHLISLIADMYFIQMGYWLVNFFVMLIFGSSRKAEPRAAATVTLAAA